jgi:hypothetical protein
VIKRIRDIPERQAEFKEGEALRGLNRQEVVFSRVGVC